MSEDCERCDGNGEIDGEVETVECPNCRDVCQWCNNPYDDGEELGDTGLVVCRECIRSMASYKEDVAYQFFLTAGTADMVDDTDALRYSMSAAICEVFKDYGIDLNIPDGWDVREEAEA